MIPEQLIEEQAATSLSDALKNVVSITRVSDNAGRQTSFTSRGFVIDDLAGYFVDGQPSFGLLEPPIETLERIEVFRGPATLQFGRAEPGGVVNLVRKRPTLTRFNSLEGTFGSYDFRHFHGDFGGPFSSPDSALGYTGYRLNLARQRSDSFRDRVFNDRDIVGAALTWQPSSRVSLTFLSDYLDHDVSLDTGVVIGADNSPVDVPIGTRLEPDGSRIDVENKTAGYDLEIDIGDGWGVRNLFNYQNFDRDRFEFVKEEDTFDPFTGDITLSEARDVRDAETYSFFFDVLGDHDFLGMRHRTVLGYHYQRLEETALFSTGENLYPTNVFNPVSIVQQPLVLDPRPVESEDDFHGVYLEDFIGLSSSLDLLVGVRYDDYKESTVDRREENADTEVNDNNEITPRVGAVFRPIKPVSLYATHSLGAQPNGRAGDGQNEGELLEPERSKLYEVGAKTEFLDGRLAVNTAVFRIERENIPFFDEAVDLTSVVGEQTHEGFELEVIGQIAEGWNVIASYAYLDAEITRDPVLQGNTPVGSPPHSGNAWTSYAFEGGALRHLTLFGGVFAQSSWQGDNDNTYKHEGYARVDIGASYDHTVGPTRLHWQLNVENLFDEEYFYGNNRLVVHPGAPLSVRGSLRIGF